ncbi:MAG: DUF2283 domain-containing protein [Chloroflexota bacterium]
MRVHYDPEVDIALMVLERGETVSEEHEWGLIDRDPGDDHLMGFEVWEASRRPQGHPRRDRHQARRRGGVRA